MTRHALRIALAVVWLSTTLTLGATGENVHQPDATSQRLEPVNIVPDFLRFWELAKDKDETIQVSMFRTMVMGQHTALFKENIVNLSEDPSREKELDRDIARFLQSVASYVPAIRTINERLDRDLLTYGSHFLEVFPDFRTHTPVYFTISMNSFDGATRDVDGHPALLFGLDVIARIYGPEARLSVLFDHELFHVYHMQVTPSMFSEGPLWKSLWVEGLATYVSWRMNAAADEGDALLNRELAIKGSAALPCLAGSLLKDIDSVDPKTYSKYFMGGKGAGDPPRSGYYVGFKVVSALGQRRSLLELSRMQGQPLENEMRTSLQQLSISGSCPSRP